MKNIFFALLTTILFLNYSIATAQQKEKIDSLQKLLKVAKQDTIKVNILYSLFKVTRGSDPKQALKYSVEGLHLSQSLNYKKGIGLSYNCIANFYANQSEFDSALVYFTKALSFMPEKKGIVDIYNNIAVMYDYKGDFNKSLMNHFKSLKIAEEINDKEGIANSENNIGSVYDEMKDNKTALTYFYKSYEIRSELGDKYSISSSCNNIGAEEEALGNSKKALEFYLRSIKLAEDINEKSLLGDGYINVSTLYTKEKNFVLAQEYNFKSLKLYQDIGDQKGEANAYYNISNCCMEQQQYKQSVDYAQKGIDISKLIGFKEGLKKGYDQLSENFTKLHQFEKALQYYELFSNMKDSLFGENNSKQIEELSTKYQSEKKEKEIIFLTKDKEILIKDKKLQQSELAQQKIINYSVIAGLIMLAMLTFFILRGYREKKRSNEILFAQNEEITRQRDIIEEKNKDITDSINYAKRIQEAILPENIQFNRLLKESFILFIPKDIVSGDFYWLAEKNNKVVIAAADCTGHGVPGALMSMIGNTLLSEIVNEKNILSSDEILFSLREGIIRSLKQTGADGEAKDGMDIALCVLDKKNMLLEFSGANNPIYIIRNNELNEIKGDKQPIGIYKGEPIPYKKHSFALYKNDCVYIFTDGFADQFGGPKGKKLKYKSLQKLLLSIQHQSMKDQQLHLKEFFEEWKGSLSQVDDILLIGFRI